MRRQHLARVNRHTRHHDSIMEYIIPMPVRNMRIEAHIHDIEDGRIVDAHAERRVIGEDEAVDLSLVSFLSQSN